MKKQPLDSKGLLNNTNAMDVKYYSSRDFPSYLPKLNALYDDLFSGGKGFRSKLVQKVSAHLGLSEKKVILLSQTIEFIHNASLLHDDLIDRSELRRNKPAAWLKYTPEYAVLAGDYLLARVMVNLSSHGNVKLIKYTAQVISDLLEGEWIQDSLIFDWGVTLEQLSKVHNLKTSSLFKWCLRAPFIANENYDERLHELLEEMGSILGALFQRSDDLLDFGVRNAEEKIVLSDLKSGYLNSFGSQLMIMLSSQDKELFKKSQSLLEVKRLVGEQAFDQKVESFDDGNQKLIDLYSHLVQEVCRLTTQDSKKLSENLSPLAHIMYWREQP